MGSNKFLNGEGQADLTELLNEINNISNEVEGKLDKDGADGGTSLRSGVSRHVCRK